MTMKWNGMKYALIVFEQMARLELKSHLDLIEKKTKETVQRKINIPYECQM